MSYTQPPPALLSPSTSDSTFTNLLNVDSAPSDPLSSPSSPAHAIDIVRPCRLLDVPSPIRSMMLDYMDDHSAIQYLSTCQPLHAGYHQYPLKRALTVDSFLKATQLDAYFEHIRRVRLFVLVISCFSFVGSFSVFMPRTASLVFLAVYGTAWVITWASQAGMLIARRKDCCTSGRWGMWRRQFTMPRVQKLSDRMWDVRLLPYLQHVTELTTAYGKHWPIGSKEHPLPHSLRTLTLEISPELELKPDTLPPRLTSLSLSVIKSMPLPVGVLPQSLTSLHLTYCFDTSCGIEEGVLPSSLVTLRVDEWKLPLSHIALPASLIEVDVRLLHDHPLPVLPSQLEVLQIGGWFNQPLIGVLPSSLRVLRLTGLFSQPFTSDVFESTPQLEELYLSDLSPVRQLVARVLPRSLQVLSLGKRHTIRELSDLPSQLRRLIVPARWEASMVSSFKQLGQARGFAVEQEAA